MVKPRFATGHRRVAGVMNKLEAAYASVLEGRKRDGLILWYRYEGMTFRLADRVRYTPDFSVEAADGTLEAHEVKGRWGADNTGRVKIKMAAELYPVRFIGVTRQAKRDGGNWLMEEF